MSWLSDIGGALEIGQSLFNIFDPPDKYDPMADPFLKAQYEKESKISGALLDPNDPTRQRISKFHRDEARKQFMAGLGDLGRYERRERARGYTKSGITPSDRRRDEFTSNIIDDLLSNLPYAGDRLAVQDLLAARGGTFGEDPGFAANRASSLENRDTLGNVLKGVEMLDKNQDFIGGLMNRFSTPSYSSPAYTSPTRHPPAASVNVGRRFGPR